MTEHAHRPASPDLQAVTPTEDAQGHGALTAPAPATPTLTLEPPWRNPEPWWLRGGVRPYLLLADIVAFVIATVLTSPTSPAHVVVLLVYLAVFHAAGLYRSRLTLSLLDDLPYILAASLVGFALKLALISLLPRVDPPGRQIVHALVLLAAVLAMREISYTVVRRARRRGKVRHRTSSSGRDRSGPGSPTHCRNGGTTDSIPWGSSTALL